jgi:hypothetical protein
MLFDLEELLTKPSNQGIEASDMEEAADRLLSQQNLYRDDFNARKTYELILRFRNYFTDLFEAIGRDLVITERELMIELRPRESAARKTLKLDETILLLSLRAAFEQGVSEFDQGDYGEISISSMVLLERYEPTVNRPRPPWPRVREILKTFKQHRFIDLGDEYPDKSGIDIIIRPAIRSVTGDGYLARIEAFIQAAEADDIDPGVLAPEADGSNDNDEADAS